MQLTELLLVCTMLLGASGALDAPCKKLQIHPWDLFFLALTAFSLREFTISAGPELTLSAAGIAVSCMLMLMTQKPFRQAQPAACVSSLLLALSLGAIDAVLGLHNGPVLGLACGIIVGMLFSDIHRALLFSILVPCLIAVVSSGLELVWTGYSSCDLTVQYLTDAQALACMISFLTQYLRSGMHVAAQDF